MAKRNGKASGKASGKISSASKLRKQIEQRFEKTLERTVEKAMQIPQVELATSRAKRAASEAMRVKVSIGESISETIDQALLDLQHKALDLKSQPQDLIQKVGQRVLERAERIRAQVAETPYSPTWLKDLSLAPKVEESGEADEASEDSDEELASGAVVETKKAKVTLATSPAHAADSSAAADMEPETYETATKAGKPSKLKKATAATNNKSKAKSSEKSVH